MSEARQLESPGEGNQAIGKSKCGSLACMVGEGSVARSLDRQG